MNKLDRILGMIFIILGLFCATYFLFLILIISPNFSFNYIWLFLGVILLFIGLKINRIKKSFHEIPKGIGYSLKGFLLVGGLFFIFIEGLIIRQGFQVPQYQADYVIVLGAKVNGTIPSKILSYRIDKAFEYLYQNEEIKVIVSGGKGNDENISEAQAMENELIKKGISKERIYKEEYSTSTKENLDFSKNVIEKSGGNIEKERVVIVTTDFHLLRSVQIAKKLGYENVEGLPSKSVWYLIPANYFREFFAIIKDKVVGNM